jgi:hypothetical protein
MGLTVTVVVKAAEVPFVLVTVRTYVVVDEGETPTAVPLVTARFPGVMTPAPFAKTAVRLAAPPAVTAVGLAVKLVMLGTKVFDEDIVFKHPARPNKPTLRTSAKTARRIALCMESPVIREGVKCIVLPSYIKRNAETVTDVVTGRMRKIHAPRFAREPASRVECARSRHH